MRPEFAPTALKIDTIKIDVDKIKIVIGKVEKPSMQDHRKCRVKIDIDE